MTSRPGRRPCSATNAATATRTSPRSSAASFLPSRIVALMVSRLLRRTLLENGLEARPDRGRRPVRDRLLTKARLIRGRNGELPAERELRPTVSLARMCGETLERRARFGLLSDPVDEIERL